ncbi:MAG: deoxyguanosinetriphosphate triphosphohydrolase, partial [Burkholderiales bacterium]|nr:deoxyguanosinetriphosphate triphosphohydrolase [Anaerolineae bacterium]
GSIEAQIANVSDELAYNAHDLDDGFQSGLITAAQVRELEIWRYVCDRSGECDPLNEIQRHLFIRELIGFEVMDMLNATTARLEAIKPQSPQDIQRQPVAIVGHSDEFKAMNRALKDFLYANMYYHYRIVRMKQRAGRFLSDVFKSYVEEPRQLPNQYQALVPEHGLHRVVADYIASMTDRGALLEYRHLFDPLMRP